MKSGHKNYLFFMAASLILVMLTAQQVRADGADNFSQTNLVSDLPGVAAVMDPNLVNPWGMSSSPTSPIWVSDNGTGLSTLYTGAGGIVPLVVTIPAPMGESGPSAPTGQVFNSTTAFGTSHFIFATEDGTIAAWSGGTTASLVGGTPGAVYKGLALVDAGSNSHLYATDFVGGKIDVFDGTFQSVTLSGSFKDPNLPAGYSPFNIQNIGGKLYVTYAVTAGGKDDVPGPGNGIVDVFDAQGNFLQRLTTGGALNSPWGLAMAPSGFGSFGGDLLVGNFGDGTINAYDPITGMWIGVLDGSNGMPLVNQGLWGLRFGNGGSGGDQGELFFTAGIPGAGEVEDHGLFGSITETPEPGSLTLLGSGLLGLIAYARRRRTLLAA